MKSSKEFIDLASHPDIQAMLTPEVGMWAVTPDGIIYLIADPLSINQSEEKGPAILLPSLEWLMEKLRELTSQPQVGYMLRNNEWAWEVFWYEKGRQSPGQYTRGTPGYHLTNNSAPLAALLALRRVMGIEEK